MSQSLLQSLLQIESVIVADLYLDSQSEIALKKEASLFDLSPSAFVRVLAKIWSEPADAVLTMTIAQLRVHVQEIVVRENRRV